MSNIQSTGEQLDEARKINDLAMNLYRLHLAPSLADAVEMARQTLQGAGRLEAATAEHMANEHVTEEDQQLEEDINKEMQAIPVSRPPEHGFFDDVFAEMASDTPDSPDDVLDEKDMESAPVDESQEADVSDEEEDLEEKREYEDATQ